MNWTLVKLKDIASAKVLSLVDINDGEDIWHLNLDQIEANSGRVMSKLIAPIYGASNSIHGFNEKYVLYSKWRPYLNKVVLPDEIGIASTELVPLLPDPKRLERKYLAYYLRSIKFVNWISKQVTGTQIPIVSMKVFWEHEIQLPSLKEQKRIVNLLDKADVLRGKRNEAINLADEFLRSVFWNMFGDPITNSKQFKLVQLSTLYADKKRGSKHNHPRVILKKEEYVDRGIPVWDMNNISSMGNFDDKPEFWITEEKFKDLEDYSVESGDVIISKDGRTGVVRTHYSKSLISTNLISIRFNQKLLPEYFVCLITYYKGSFGRLKIDGNVSLSHINLRILDSLVFPLPSISLQQKFINIFNKVSEQKHMFENREHELSSSLSFQTFSDKI